MGSPVGCRQRGGPATRPTRWVTSGPGPQDAVSTPISMAGTGPPSEPPIGARGSFSRKGGHPPCTPCVPLSHACLMGLGSRGTHVGNPRSRRSHLCICVHVFWAEVGSSQQVSQERGPMSPDKARPRVSLTLPLPDAALPVSRIGRGSGQALWPPTLPACPGGVTWWQGPHVTAHSCFPWGTRPASPGTGGLC